MMHSPERFMSWFWHALQRLLKSLTNTQGDTQCHRVKSRIRKKEKKTRLDWEYITFGMILIAIALGSMFSIELVRYGYWILIVSSLLLVHYVMNGLRLLNGKGKLRRKSYFFGFLGLVLLILFLGIQSPQIPFKIWILGIGLIFLVWWILKSIWNR